MSRRVPTFAYEFNDDTAPQRFAPPGALPPIATHSAEIQYLFDQPNTPVPATLNADQLTLATTMRTAWANFATTGNPSSRTVPWPALGRRERVLSLVTPRPVLVDDFTSKHNCDFWAAG